MDKESFLYLQLKCDFLIQKAVLMEMLSDYKQTEELLENALAIARNIGDKITEATILIDYAHLYFSRGIYTKSLEKCKETLKIVGKERNQLYYVALNDLLANYMELNRDEQADDANEMAIF